MPDTIQNQEAYPQHSSQKKGCGFPLAKIGVLFSYATGVVREVRAYICIPEFRTEEITVVTTLLDAIEYPAVDILKLYDQRWEAEINLRHIKTNARYGYFKLPNTRNGQKRNLYLFISL